MARVPALLLLAAVVGCGQGPAVLEPDDPTPPPAPVEEVCNGQDDDGDGVVDEGFADSDGDSLADCVDPPPCNGLSLPPEEPIALDPTCAGSPWAIERSAHWPAPSAGLLSFGPAGDTDGDGEVGPADEHVFVFVEREAGKVDVLPDEPVTQRAIRVLGTERDDRLEVGSILHNSALVLSREGEQVRFTTFVEPTRLEPSGDLGVNLASYSLDGVERWRYGDGPLDTGYQIPGAGAWGNYEGRLHGVDLDGDGGWDLRTGAPLRVGNVDVFCEPDVRQWGGIRLGLPSSWLDRQPNGASGGLSFPYGPLAGCDLLQSPEIDPSTSGWPNVSPWFGSGLVGLGTSEISPLRPIAPAELDGDPGMESFWAGRLEDPGLPSNAPQRAYSTVVALDDDGTWLWSAPVVDVAVGGSDPCSSQGPTWAPSERIVLQAADLDGDGRTELVGEIRCDHVVYPVTRVRVDDDGTIDFAVHDDFGRLSNGYQPSLFDFDGDGTLEVVSFVGGDLSIWSSETGETLARTAVTDYTLPPYLGDGNYFVSSFPLPIIDVDGDGSADIVVPWAPDGDDWGISVYSHPDGAWPPTGRVWTDGMMRPACVGGDLLPRECGGWWANGSPSRGNIATGPATPSPRAGLELEAIDWCAQCGTEGRSAAVSARLINRGALDLDGPIVVEVRAEEGGPVLGSVTVENLPSATASAAQRIDLDTSDGMPAMLLLSASVPSDVPLCRDLEPLSVINFGCEQ